MNARVFHPQLGSRLEAIIHDDHRTFGRPHSAHQPATIRITSPASRTANATATTGRSDPTQERVAGSTPGDRRGDCHARRGKQAGEGQNEAPTNWGSQSERRPDSKKTSGRFAESAERTFGPDKWQAVASEPAVGDTGGVAWAHDGSGVG